MTLPFVGISFFSRPLRVKTAWGAWKKAAQHYGGSGPGGWMFWQPKLSAVCGGRNIEGKIRAEPVRRNRSGGLASMFGMGNDSTAMTTTDAEEMGKNPVMRWFWYFLSRRKKGRGGIGSRRRRRNYRLAYFTDFKVELGPKWKSVTIVADEDDITPADSDGYLESQFRIQAPDKEQLLSSFSQTGADSRLLELSAMFGHVQIQGGTLLARSMNIIEKKQRVIDTFDEMLGIADAMDEARAQIAA